MEGHAWTEARTDGALGVAPSAEAARIGRNIAALASGQLVTWTMTLAWTLVVPRLLGPGGIGLIIAGQSVTGILAIALGFGTKSYLVRAIVVGRNEASGLLATATVLRLMLAPVFLAVVVVFAHFAGYGREGNLVLYLSAAATVLTLLAEPMQSTFQAIERMKYLAYSDVINKSVQGLLGIVLVVMGFGAVGFAGCWMVMSGVVLALDAVWLRRYVRLELRTNARRLAHMAKESVAYWAFGLFFMIYLWIDATMLSLMTNSTVVGWYGVPTKLFQSLMVVPVLVSTAWLPRLVNVFEREPSELQQAARTPIEFVLAVGVAIGAAFAAGAAPMIHLVYGPAYDKAIPVMAILGVCIPAMYMNIMLNQVLIAAKRQKVWTWVMAGATVVNPAANAVLIPLTQARLHNGAIGASIALVATEVLIVAVGVALVGRGVFDRRGVRRVLRVTVASGAMWGVSYALRGLGGFPSLAVAGLTFVALAILLRLVSPAELALVRQHVRMPGTRPFAARWARWAKGRRIASAAPYWADASTDTDAFKERTRAHPAQLDVERRGGAAPYRRPVTVRLLRRHEHPARSRSEL